MPDVKRVLRWSGYTVLALGLLAASLVSLFLYQFGALPTLADWRADSAQAQREFTARENELQQLLTAARAEHGYTSLFDGTTLAGWRGDTGVWRVAEGAITGAAPQGLDTSNYLWSEGQWSNFILRFEVKVVGESFANSGVFYRARKRDQDEPPMIAYQADIDFTPQLNWQGGFYIEHGERPYGSLVSFTGERLWVDSNGGRVLVEQLAAPEELMHATAKNQWLRYTVIAAEDRFIHLINDRIYSDTLLSEVKLQRGRLALQLHQGPPMSAHFRKLEIRAL